MGLLNKLRKLTGKKQRSGDGIACLTGNVALPARVYDAPIRRIIMLKLDHLGDFFVAIKAMTMVRQAWPSAHITLVCGSWNASLAAKLAMFDHIIPFSFFNETSSKSAVAPAYDFATIAEVVQGEFDLAIDLRHDDDTRRFLDHINAKYRVGYVAAKLQRPLALCLPNMEPSWRPPKKGAPVHSTLSAEGRLTLLAAATIDVFGPKAAHPVQQLATPQPSQLTLPENGYAVIAVGAGSPLRKWRLERFIDLAKLLVAEFGLKVVLIGGASDREANAALAANLPPSACHDLTGIPIADVPPIVSRARLFVGNDTGTTHLAAFLDVPTVCLYGGMSDPDVWQPIGRNVTLVRAEVACSFCRLAHASDCPHDNICMTGIRFDTVVEEIQRLLQQSDPGSARAEDGELKGRSATRPVADAYS